ncbi:MAG: C39 family peptidase [Candidatus Peribacteraceae bacterium]|nr:C39 family peptidase [Candidatus Peribacteraceae bacterium]
MPAVLSSSSTKPVPSSSSAPASMPGSVLIEVPFASQAPFGKWDEMHEETCEEAALLLGQAFAKGETSMSETTMEQRLQAIVAWEEQNGYGIDVNVDEAAAIARDYLDLDVRVLKNVTEADLVRELAAGNPIVAPFAGRELGNPYFSGEGPWYHMLIIIGYDSDSFITNDVGTKRGARYAYDRDVLMSALHDWTGVKEETNTGAKNVLVIDANR